jgi:hypothetical protein
MPLHRLLDPTYNGGTFPATHDKINDPAANGDPGVPALSDGKITTTGHANEGSYYVGFGQDGTSKNGNRPHDALAQSTDFLDDVCSGDLPVPAELEAVAGGGGVTTLVIAGDVFVGMQGLYTDTQPFRDRLIKVIDNTTGNDMVDDAGVKVECSRIRDNLNVANAVGVPAIGFENAPTITFSPAIPAARSYRIVYGKRSSLANGIRSKVDLDLLSRLAVRAAHQTSAEAIRFITQASRRTGGNITALAASLIETPRGAIAPGGSILPASNQLLVDIDPTDVGGAAGGGLFSVTFDRDGTPRSVFEAVEETGGEPYMWRTNVRATARDIGICFKDPNIEEGALDYLPLTTSTSGEGDNYVRVYNKDPESQTHPMSIVKGINARHVITCGDGSSSFGDFNGVTALADAIAFIKAATASEHGYHIVLKKGAYEVDNLDLSTTNNDFIIIEGVHRSNVGNQGASIRCMATLGATSAGLTCTTGFKMNITFRNISFEGLIGATGELALYFLNCYVLIEDCRFTNSMIRTEWNDTSTVGNAARQRNVFQMKRCQMNWTSANGTIPLLHYALRDAGQLAIAEGFVVEDCYLTSQDDVPIMRVENIDTSVSPSKLGGVLFNRCRMELGTTDDNAGNLAGNSSVIEIVAGTTGAMQVGTFEWRDCDVTIQGIGAHRPLFYARLGNGVGSLFSTNDDAVWKIKGGTWTASPVGGGADISTFYLGSTTYNGGSPVTAFYVEDVAWGHGPTLGASNGVPAAEVVGPAAADWAAFFIAAGTVVMKNVTWITNSKTPTSGDLLVYDARRVDIDGLYLGTSVWKTTIGTDPNFRVKVVLNDFTQFGICEIANVMITAGGTNGAAALGLLVVDRVPSAAQTFPSLVRNCSLAGNDTTGGAGIYLKGELGANANDWHIVDCVVDDVDGPGIHVDCTAGGGIDPLEGLRITRCRIYSCTEEGILLDFGANNFGLHNACITDCHIQDCLGLGLYVTGTLPWQDNHPGLVLTGNTFYNNNGGISNRQVELDRSEEACGAMYGNCAGGAATPGLFAMLLGPRDDWHGSETGYNYNGAVPAAGTITNSVTESAAAVDVRMHADLAHMLHNRFRYET